MHPAVTEFVSRFATNDVCKVLEFGSRNVNGTVRSLFPNAHYVGVDRIPGSGVDIVADASEIRPPDDSTLFDYVICTEVFEHDPNWASLCLAAYLNLRVGGIFICTAAGPDRLPHSGIDGQELREGEHYKNISSEELQIALKDSGFTDFIVDLAGADVRARATKT